MKRSRNVWDQKRGIWQLRISEEMVLQEIVERLWLQARIKVWRIRERIPGVGKLSTPGLADLIGVVPHSWSPWVDGKRFARTGVALFLEVKRPGGAHRPVQTLFIDEVKASGAIAGFVDSWASCVALLSQYGIDLKV